METDPLRSCQWSQSTSENNNSLNSPPRITSFLWKQLSEEQDLSEVKLTSLTDTFVEDVAPSSEHDADSNFLLFSKSQDVWKVPSSELDVDTSQFGLRNPWDPMINTSQRSCNLTNFSRSSSLSSARHSSILEEGIYGKSKENIFPTYTKALGHNENSQNTILNKRDSISLSKDLLPPQQGLASSVWDTDPKVSFESSSQDTLTGTDSYGLSGNSKLWEPVPLSQRSALRNIGNISQPSLPNSCQKTNNIHLIQTQSELSSHRTSLPFSIPSHDSYCNQEAISTFQSQKQHTDLVALMQELSLLTDARDMGNLSYSSTYTSQKPPQTNPSLSSKGCVFCKNNNYHSTFYKSHVLKDERGHCQCPVLRMYVCPLCNATGDSAHTLKYCPRNTVTRGDPISAGLPPGKVTNWREVANRMMNQYSSNN